MSDATSSGRSGMDPPPFWLTPPSYWLPAHYPLSAWFTHAPFAAWLMDVLRPSRVIELGTHLGFSSFAFAEAARRLGSETLISALDSWEGDDQAGFYGEEVYQYVTSVVDSRYPTAIELVRGYFSELRPRFDGTTVDLLHIDGRHAYEDAKTDYSEYQDLVRPGGVILFHDIAERENGFGVWRLWEEIAEPGRSFAFEHGHGLGVLAVGQPIESPLRALFEADDQTKARIRRDFSELGDVVQRQAWLESLPAELERETNLAHTRALRVNELEAAVASQQAQIEALLSSTSWRLTAPLRAAGRLRRTGA